MTSTLTDRRRATLERQAGYTKPAKKKSSGSRFAGRDSSERQATERRSAPRKIGVRRMFRSVRNAQQPTKVDRQRTLGPPPGTFYVIAGVVIAFVMLGLVMVLSASAVTQSNLGNSPYGVFARQAMWAGLGLLGMIIAAKVPYTAWRSLTIPLAVVGVLVMATPFVPGIGVTINGAQSWV